MPAEDPLKQRDRLQAELKSAHRAEHEAREFIRHVEAEIDRTSRARVEEYTKRARGHLDDGKPLAELEGQWEDARGALERSQQKLAAAQSAVTAVENEIASLLLEHLPLFAAEAEEATALARKALQSLAGPYAHAHASWVAAERAWLPLQRPITETLLQTEAADGLWRDRGQAGNAARVPRWVLPEPAFLNGLPPARPPGLSKIPQEAAA
jgi:hypothetical protein